MKQDKFPNGFTSWAETHFEIVSAISLFANETDEDRIPDIISFTYRMGGRGALYELAEDWTDEFERASMYSYWDEDEQLEKIETFVNNKLNNNADTNKK